MVENITDENYEAVIQSSASLIAYGIGSCVPCAAYDPILESTSSQFPHIRIGKAKMHVPGKCREIKNGINLSRIPLPTCFHRETFSLQNGHVPNWRKKPIAYLIFVMDVDDVLIYALHLILFLTASMNMKVISPN